MKEKFLTVFTGKGLCNITATNATGASGNGEHLTIRALVSNFLQIGVE